MPTYTYTCTNCGATIERRQSFSDAPLTTCETCGGDLRKVFHPVGIVFKGSGWYVTDSRGKSSTTSDTSASSSSEPAKTDSGAEKSDKKDAPASTDSTPAASTPAPASTSTPPSSSSTT